MARKPSLAAALVALPLIWLAAGAALAAGDVAIRAAVHEGFGRIVFDWPSPVEYETAIDGKRLTITFDQPVNTSFDTLRRVLGGYVSDARLGDDGRSVIVELVRGYKVRAFRYEQKIIVDLLDALAEAPEPAAQAPDTQAATPNAAPDSAADSSGLDSVRVRIGDHEGFSRVVFDWPGAVDYQLERDGGQVVIRFDRAARIDLADLNASPLQLIHAGAYQAENGATRVILQIEPTSRLRHFRADLRVVIDVLDEPAKAEATPAAPEVVETPADETPADEAPNAEMQASETQDPETQDPETQAAEMDGGEAPDGVMETAMAPDAVPDTTPDAVPDATPEAPLDLVSATAPSAEPTTAAADGALADLPPAVTDDGAADPDMVADEADAAPQATVEQAMVELAMAEQAMADTQSPGESQSTDGSGLDIEALTTLEPADFVALQASGGQTAQLSLGPPPMNVSIEIDTSYTLVTFDGGTRIAAAAFVRGGYLWVVFENRYALDLASVSATSRTAYDSIEQRKHDSATIVRFAMRDGYGVTMRRRGVLWLVQFTTTPQPPTAIEVRVVDAASGSPRIQLPVTRVGAHIQLRDPYDRSTIDVVPVFASGRGITAMRRFPQFDLLATVQGIAIRAPDQIEVFTTLSGLEISAPPTQAAAEAEPTSVKNRARPVTALFDLVAWRRGGDDTFIANRALLLRAIATASPAKLGNARFELARFLFAHGYMPEAKGVLDVLTAEQPARAENVSFRAMRGVINLTMGRPLEAAQDLAGSNLDVYDDIAMWRGVLAMEQNDVSSASAYFAQAGDLWLELPSPLRSRIGLMAAEALLEGGDITTANAHLDVLRSVVADYGVLERVKHLKGRLRLAAGSEEDAIALWRDVAAGTDRLARARAIFDDTMLMLNNGEMTTEEAISEFEGLRYAWRADRFELSLLEQLSMLYISNGQYRKGLVTMKRAVTHFSSYRMAAVIAARMNELFTEIFLHDGAEDLSAIDALTLYYEFQELTPVGREGDGVIQKLADRLVALDLLDRAADLLSHQLKYRLRGIEKARVGTRLAVIHLMNGNPENAIRVLRQSRSSKLPIELATQRRHLRARALADLGRDDDALKRLVGDDSRDAELLRADVYWRAGNWPEVAATTERLLALTPTEAPLNPFASRHILRLAVALALADDRDGMARLRAEFSAAMRDDPNQEAFDVISDDSGSLATNFRELPAAVAQVASFEAFMTSYRERVKSTSLSAIN